MDISPNDSLIIEFIAEGRDHLDSIEPDLLAMEEGVRRYIGGYDQPRIQGDS